MMQSLSRDDRRLAYWSWTMIRIQKGPQDWTTARRGNLEECLGVSRLRRQDLACS